ncbi:nodulation protein NfeD [bacterium]|nr:nodulation protein NfeD [bacterium]
MKKICLFTFLMLLFLTLAVSDTLAQTKINMAKVEGVIDPVVAKYILRNIERCEKEKAILLIEIDTPGGLMDSMHDINKGILNAKIPIIIYVSPKGARAASAGTFITLAAHIAAMAPGTTMGAAHPVQMGQKIEDEELKKKITNDAVAQMEGICKQRGRDADWPTQAVTKSVSASAEELLKLKVIDVIAEDIDDLLTQIDGRKIKVGQEEVELLTKEAKREEVPMNFRDKFLHIIAHPNIAYILLILGIYGLIYEFSSPGIGLGAIVGGICLILAFFSLQTLPVNLAGLLLIILGIIFFVLETQIISFGLLTIGGITSLTLGSFMLIDTLEAPFFAISWQLILGVVLFTTFFILFCVGKIVQVHKRKAVTGREGLIGAAGYAKEDFKDGEGMVYLEGAYWSGIAKEEIKEKDGVEVVEVLPAGKLGVKKRSE